ncbi:hypothetical protein ACFPZ0_23875 [Streptomonospora nanhaiensis]|uniref:Uncharacterized protein n=1 Tax=Streptomonospora nanhaiensis TaxID=1323731 RepID=A0A853BQE4_9ACTN|nr:hypothetical protein [Streptomonospora nanhaiensis]NYI97648.1 hypothetical protein [Streptomonospora nanhaiensis]
MNEDLSALDRLETDELRDRAVALARRRWDVKFFWRLLRLLPAAEAAAGNVEAGEAGVAQASGLFYDALAAEEDPVVQDALRPVYIDYLTEHGAFAETDTATRSASGSGTESGPGPKAAGSGAESGSAAPAPERRPPGT